MHKCFLCAIQTGSCDSGVPVCATCLNARAAKSAKPKPQVLTAERSCRDNLIQALIQATARARATSIAFSAIADDLTGKVKPNGVQRLHKASAELSRARDEMLNAHNRLKDFLSRGIVPEDLKQSRRIPCR